MQPGLHPIQRGFSLIELVLVLATVVTISAIAVPRYAAAMEHYRLESAVQRVVADLAMAKRRANFASNPVSITFYPLTGKYQIVGIAKLNGGKGWYTVNLAADPYRVACTTTGLGNNNLLSFDGYGTPTSGGTLVISAGGRQRTITIDPTSGSASVQ